MRRYSFLVFCLLICFFLGARELPSNFKQINLHSSYDKTPLSVLVGTPKGTPKGIVQLVHGMCEYKERYVPFMEFLTQHGYVCIIHDHRGHGESVFSDDDLGYFGAGGYWAMILDTHEITNYIQESYAPSLPLFLFGHSMGSMVVRAYAKRFDADIDGLVVCGSPSYSSASKVGAMIAKRTAKKRGDRYRSKGLQDLVFGNYNKDIKGASSANAWLCSDDAVVDAYDADSKCNFTFTANGFEHLFGLMQDTYSVKGWHTSKPNLPILFVSGSDDPCYKSYNKFNKSVKVMKKAGYSTVDSRLYDNMRHEILNEIGKEKIWNDLLVQFDWWCKQ